MASRTSPAGMPFGSGTRPVTGSASSGLVPQVTIGAMAAASRVTSVSNRASGSLGRLRQYATAWSHAAPFGENGRP